MNLINLLVVLLVCVYQGGVEGVQVKRCPCKDRYFPVGRVPDERSVTLTIRNVSAASAPTVILVGGREETAMTSLMRAADSDSRFEFSGKYTEADGFCVTGFQGRTNGEDGHWEISTFPKDGGDSVPITSGLDRVIPKVGGNLVFSFLPPQEQLVTCSPFLVSNGTISPEKSVYELDELVNVTCNCGISIMGSANVSCLETGNWTAIPECKAGSDWEIIFLAKAGSGQKIYDAWTGSESVDSNIPCTDLYKSDLYKSDRAEEWNTVDKVKVAVLKNNEEKSYFIFNGQGANKNSFFDHDRLVNSSNGRLKGQSFEFFSAYGDDSLKYRFFITKTFGACVTDNGWLLVIDVGNDPYCDYDKQGTQPLFIYCVGETVCKLSTAPTGDTFTISVTRM